MWSRQIVAELIDEFEGDGLDAGADRQERNAVAGPAGRFLRTESFPRERGENLANSLAFFGGKLFGGSQDIVVNADGGSHGVSKRARIKHQTSYITSRAELKRSRSPGRRIRFGCAFRIVQARKVAVQRKLLRNRKS